MSTRTVVVDTLERVCPLIYAERTWDNVGLLLEGFKQSVEKIMITNDLTEVVLQEAIDVQADLIISYHPPWFRPEKRMTLEASNGLRIVCRAAMHGISLYSPHTALDAMQGGINDWLASPFNKKNVQVIQRCQDDAVTDNNAIGYGRTIELQNELSIADACDIVIKFLSLKRIRLAKAINDKKAIKTVAVCAGAGGSLLTPKLQVDLAITGELSHHQILALNAAGTHVILTEHSNSERNYLKTIYADMLKKQLPDINIVFSEQDKDPIEIV